MIRRLVPLALVLALLGAFGIQGALAAPAGPPTGVTGLAQSGAVQLAWQPVSGADTYVVLRGTSATNITTTVTPAGGVTGTSFTNTGLSNSTTYYYVVRAVGGSVTSANSTIAQVSPRSSTCSGANGIVTENCFPGTTAWKTTNVDDAIDGIEGYATASSINAGESVGIKVNSAANASYRMEIYRTGSYNGSQGRLISTIPNLTAVSQPACDSQANTGLLDCANWSTSATLTTTSAWKSGVYLIRLVRSNGTDYHVLLTVRNDSASADVLYVVPDTTYQAYNNYGGKSLYTWSSSGANTLAGATRAVKVSFDRPYNEVRTEQHDWYTTNDLRMVSWMESQGYNVGYITATDLDRDPSLVSGKAAVVLGGHDEYYSTVMRNTITAARNAGTSLFFSGANSVYWQIRFEASPTSGASRRVQVAYKTVESGPSDPQGPTSTWRDPNGANQPENGLVGIMYLGDSDFTFFPLRVSAAEGQDPVWRHTDVSDLAAGTFQNVGSGLVGWEWDGRVDNGSQPAGLRVLASSPVTGNLSQGNGASVSPGSTVVNVTKYTAPSGALVFATGTNNWNRGLDRNEQGDGEPNLIIQQATTNVLSDMGVQPQSPDAEIVVDADSPPRVLLTSPGDTATGVAVDTSPVAAFSREMNPATITSSTVSLRTQAGTLVPATITYNAATRRATIDPTASLALQTTYVARVTTGAQATDGTPLEQQAQWTFTTADPPPPPTVTATVPAGNATGVNPGSAVTATFSRAMNAATITSSSFRLTGPGGGTIPATVSYDAATTRATLTPSASLALGTAYTASLTTAIAAADGTAMAAAVNVGFSTWTQPPPAPTVTLTTPADGATGVEVGSIIAATFSRDMDASTVTGATVTLTGPGGAVPATVSYDSTNRRAVLTPTAPLAVSTAYTATWTTGIRAADGIALASAVNAGFNTSASPCPCQLFANTVAPDLASNGVQDGRSGAGPFSYEMGVKVTATTSAEIRAIRFYKSPGETGTHVGRIWTSGGTQRLSTTFTNESASGWQTQQLASPLAITAGQTYVISVNRNAFYPLTSGGLASQIVAGPIRSVIGANGVYGNSSGTFPTNSWNDSNYFVDLVVGGDDTPPPTTPPTVAATTPAAGSTDVASDVSPVATFSRAMDPATLTTASVTLRPQSGSPVSATVTYDGGTNEVTINPTADLNASTTYTAQITTAATSANGIAMASPVSWSFTTAAGPAPGAVVQLFPDTATPLSAANPVQDGRTGAGPFSYEMGVKVTATVAAEVRAIRFYKSPGETGTHIGRVWTSGGTLVGQVTFAGETASGWQTQPIASPIALTAGQTYVISVNRNNFYAFTSGGLASQITAGPVRSVVGSNGVYGQSSGTFPTTSFGNSNYFTDLQVAASETEATAPPTVSATTPADGAVNVPINVSPTAVFSRPMDGTSLSTATATVSPEGGSPVPATVTYSSSDNRVTIDPDANLIPSIDYTARISTGANADNGVALAAPVTWSFTTSATAVSSTSQLYPDTTTPATDANSVQDSRTGEGPFSYELGVKVQATLGSQIRALRFYKSAGETGTHVGRIWSAGGEQLGQVTFSGETASGWQTQELTTPLALTSGQTYVISVNANAFYPVTPAGLATQITAGPVRTIVGANGAYGDAAGTFPTTSWNNASYLVDLVVAPTEEPPPPTAPTVTATTPADDAANVLLDSSPSATFSRAMNGASLTAATVTLRPDGGSPVDATLTYDPNADRIVIDPVADLAPAQDYTVQISSAATAADGINLDGPATWSFRTASSLTTSQLFPNTATPQSDANSVADGRSGPGPFSYEMGVKITATADAQVRAIRFYKSTGETGEHVGRVWTSGGTQIGQVTFEGEGPDGWQAAQFGSPVALTAGETYVISVNRNAYYPYTPAGLASEVVAGPVRTVVGGNGVFGDAAGTFPTASFGDSDYLVDLVVTETTPPAPPVVPTVTATTPADGATDVAPNASPTATFSRAMNVASLTAASVTLTANGGAPVDAAVTYSAATRRLTINPTDDLEPARTYTAAISTAATSSGGAALAAPVSWSFTTAAAPTVTATTPADGTTSVAVNASPTATFSRAMTASTLIAGGTATLRPAAGGAPVTASVTYDSANFRVIINPTADLLTGTTYTAQVSTAARAADGAALASAVSWSFTTMAAPTVTAVTPADGTTGVVLGVSPTVTFSRPMTVGTLTAASATVRPEGGSPVAAAVSYDATNNRVTINPNADLIAGTTYTVQISTAARATDGTPLASAYTSTFETVPPPTVTATTPADGATGVAVNVSPTATFSRAMNAATLTTASATVRPPSGSAVAAVVSYDAANRRVTINPNANLSPGIVYTAQISTAATGADGVAMTSAATWSFTTQPPPTVTATTPEAGATGVAVSVSPTATFSRAMTSGSLTTSTANVRPQSGGNAVSASVSYDSGNNRVTINPSSNLALGTTYVGTITTGATASDGIALGSNFTWTFTTITAPTVTATAPVANATGIGLNDDVTATFSRAMNPSTLTTSTTTLRRQGSGTNLSATVSYDAANNRVTLNPSAALLVGTAYTASISTTAASADGVNLASTVSWNFTTIAAPTVTATTPADDAAGVAVDSPLTATFSRAMNPATLTTASATVRVQGSGGALPATVSYDAANNRVTIDPNANLLAGTVYQGQISTAAASADGIALGSTFSWSFTTPTQLFADTLTPTTPASAATLIRETGVRITLTENAQARGIRFWKSPGETGTHTGRIFNQNGTQVATVVFANETASGWQTAQLTNPVALNDNQQYTISVNRNNFYPATTNGLNSQVIAGPMRTVVGSNGVYGIVAGSRPQLSSGNTNFFVDVIVAQTL